MHKVRHHFRLSLTDTNFGNIFSIWDRLFGTIAEVKNATELTYGIDTHMDQKDHDNVVSLLAIPFQKYLAPLDSKFGREEDPSEIDSP